MPVARPLLKPALRRLWRDGSTLQLGVDPRRAVVISGVDAPHTRLLDALDGSRTRAQVLEVADELGVAAGRAESLLRLLEAAGLLDDGAADRRAVARLDRAERDRLAPDLAAASLLHGGTDGGATTLARRRGAFVLVAGAGRVGSMLAALLAAAGVGRVVADDEAPTTPGDLAPGGATADDLGTRRQAAAAAAAARAAPGVRTWRPRSGEPDVVALTSDTAAGAEAVDRLMRRGTAHLFAQVRDTTGVVGPFVLPGTSSCRRCHDLHRADRDPAWPRLAAQLAAGVADRARPALAACDVVLAAAVAAQAAAQLLAWLDGDPRPPAVDGTVEVAQADGRVRRRGWSVHPACGCGWPADRAG